MKIMSIWDRFTPTEIQQARVEVATGYRDYAAHVFDSNFSFANHVTLAQKRQIKKDWLDMADQVEAGLKDSNVSVSQSIYYYLTGTSPALLS